MTANAKPLPPGIHIILGDSAAGTFKQAFRSTDRLLIDQDVLSCGPIPRCDDLAAWKKIRLEYWDGVADDIDEHAPSPHNFVDNAHRLADAERIYLWAATGVSEQLFLAFALHVVDLVQADPSRVAVVQFERAGMGELNPEFMSAHPDPVALADSTARDYRNAWTALTSPDPALLQRFPSDHPTANHWLTRAMQLMLRRYPDKRSGLNYWDFMLLSRARLRGPKAARIIAYTMTDTHEDGDFVGDSYLFWRLLWMSDEQLPQPLLKLSGDSNHMRHTEVTLTAFGEAVLDGKASNYPTNPIDDWAGGVRLSSEDGKVWMNDGGTLAQA